MSYSGIILAGGKSSRMGQDKALMEIDGIPMIQHIANLLQKVTNEIVIASNDKKHHVFGDLGVEDNFPDSGPMAGIEAGLLAARNNACIVISCDSPFLTSSVLSELILKDDKDTVVATCNGRIHPLIGIYKKSSLDTIQAYLKQRKFKMRDLLEELNTEYLRFPDTMENAFNNLNTQEEWNLAHGK